MKNLGPLLCGIGAALTLYQIFAGRAEPGDTMAALAGAVLSSEAPGGADGFLFQTARSLTAQRLGSMRLADGGKVGAMLAGVSFGFLLGAALSFIPSLFGWLPVILGVPCLAAGAVLMAVKGQVRA